MKLLAALLLALQVAGIAVRAGSVEIIFPQAVRFMVDVSAAPSDLTSAQLTISPEGRDSISVDVDVQQAQPTDAGAHLEYVWRIPVDDPPPLFGAIRYHWSFTAADGSAVEFDDAFAFADPRVDWLQSGSQAGLSITLPRTQSPLADSLPQVLALLERNTGQSLDKRLLIYPMQPDCTPSGDDPNKQIAMGQSGFGVECDSGIAEAVFAGYRVLVLPSDATAEDFVTGTLVRDAYLPLWTGKVVPPWFADGLAQFYQPTPRNALLPPVRQAARDGTLLSLSEMAIPDMSALWRAQSFGMVLYIADRIGYQGLFELARIDADDFEAAYERAMSEPLSALIPNWQQWVFSRAAESAYGITPYQPPTPTPLPTSTASATPTASPTVTLTPTATRFPTETPPGVRTYVPPPTVTPSLTSPPPPATITPRPPGSMPTITPTPTALEAAAGQPGVLAGATTFLVLLLILLVFLLYRLGNRR